MATLMCLCIEGIKLHKIGFMSIWVCTSNPRHLQYLVDYYIRQEINITSSTVAPSPWFSRRVGLYCRQSPNWGGRLTPMKSTIILPRVVCGTPFKKNINFNEHLINVGLLHKLSTKEFKYNGKEDMNLYMQYIPGASGQHDPSSRASTTRLYTLSPPWSACRSLTYPVDGSNWNGPQEKSVSPP